MKVVTIILGILTVILGVFCIFRPGVTALSLAWMFGALMLFYGLMVVINYFTKKIGTGWDLTFGILGVIGGAGLLFNYFSRFLADAVLIYMLGIFVAVAGVLRIIAAFHAKKAKSGSWGWILVFGILSVIFGIFMVTHPMVAFLSVGYMIAFSIIMQGVNIIGLSSSLKKE